MAQEPDKKRIFNGHVAIITLLCLFFTWDETKDFITSTFSISGVVIMNIVLTLSALISIYIFVRKSIRQKEIDLSCVALLGLCILFLVVENTPDPVQTKQPEPKVENVIPVDSEKEVL